MLNLRKSGVIAGVAFILSFLISLVSHTSMPMLIIRPVFFGALFFTITGLVYFLVNRFLPELLEEDGPDEASGPHLGSRINIVEGGSSQGPGTAPSMPSFMAAESSEEVIGDISSLLEKSTASQTMAGGASAGIDQNDQDGYNKAGEVEDFPEPDAFPGDSGGQKASSGQAAVPPSIGVSDSVDYLPDLDSMAGAFLPRAGATESDNIEYSVSTPPPKPSSRNKAPEWAGDFNAKEIAAGLRTVINKDKEG